jgi:hypothetical protein
MPGTPRPLQLRPPALLRNHSPRPLNGEPADPFQAAGTFPPSAVLRSAVMHDEMTVDPVSLHAQWLFLPGNTWLRL